MPETSHAYNDYGVCIDPRVREAEIEIGRVTRVLLDTLIRDGMPMAEARCVGYELGRMADLATAEVMLRVGSRRHREAHEAQTAILRQRLAAAHSEELS